MPNPNDWLEYKRLVLAHIEKTDATLTRIEGQLTNLRVKVAGIAVGAGLLGGSLASLLSQTLN